MYGGCNAADTVSAVMTVMKDKDSLEARSSPITGYCLRCRSQQELECVEAIETKQRSGIRGRCSECNCKVVKFVGSKTHVDRPRGYYDKRHRAKKAEERRLKLLDSVPPVKASYINGELES